MAEGHPPVSGAGPLEQSAVTAMRATAGGRRRSFVHAATSVLREHGPATDAQEGQEQGTGDGVGDRLRSGRLMRLGWTRYIDVVERGHEV